MHTLRYTIGKTKIAFSPTPSCSCYVVYININVILLLLDIKLVYQRHPSPHPHLPKSNPHVTTPNNKHKKQIHRKIHHSTLNTTSSTVHCECYGELTSRVTQVQTGKKWPLSHIREPPHVKAGRLKQYQGWETKILWKHCVTSKTSSAGFKLSFI